jgi:hypothetical protein
VSQETQIEELVQKLKDKAFAVRKQAADSLIRIGKPAVDLLVATLEDETQDARELAALVLVQIGPPLNCLSSLWKVVANMDGPVRLLAGQALLKIEHGEPPSTPLPPMGSTAAFLGGLHLFVALRSLDVRRALSLASDLRLANPGDPVSTFLEGALAYSVRSDAVALERFRESLELEPLFAEAPYYVGQILVESAIDDYRRNHPGPFTAETVLRWAGTYDAALTAFAWAETVGRQYNLKSISTHLPTYEMLLGITEFSTVPSAVARLPSKTPVVELGYTTPDRWLFAIGLQYKNQQLGRREMLADLIGTLASRSSVVLVVGHSPSLSPISMLLSRRRGPTVFEVGPGTPDDILTGRISSIRGNTVILTNPRRIGFGKYFSWMPPSTKALEIVLVNPERCLSVEFLGLLARLQPVSGEAPAVHFTLVSLDQDGHA